MSEIEISEEFRGALEETRGTFEQLRGAFEDLSGNLIYPRTFFKSPREF